MQIISPVRLAAASLLAVAAPVALHAQESGALPFRAGQWAIELSSSQGSGNLGFLRFTSPGGAWLVAPGVAIRSGESEGSGGDSDVSALGLDLRLGRRGYRALGGSTVSFLGLGLHGARTSFEEDAGSTEASVKEWSAGIYGELGGTYFFTPRFGLGASATAELAYGQSTFDAGFGESEDTSTSFSFPSTRVLVTIAF